MEFTLSKKDCEMLSLAYSREALDQLNSISISIKTQRMFTPMDKPEIKELLSQLEECKSSLVEALSWEENVKCLE